MDEQLIEFDADLKKQTLLIDRNFEEIRSISQTAFDLAKKTLYGEKIESNVDVPLQVEQLQKLLNLVEDDNREEAKKLVSEAVLDFNLYLDSNSKITSLRMGRIMKRKKGEKYLPIGTVVMLKGGTKRVMIIGFCAIAKNTGEKIYDYSGCLYPEGLLSSEQIALFDHEQIEKVYHIGLADDDEEREFKEKLRSITKG